MTRRSSREFCAIASQAHHAFATHEAQRAAGASIRAPRTSAWRALAWARVSDVPRGATALAAIVVHLLHVGGRSRARPVGLHRYPRRPVLKPVFAVGFLAAAWTQGGGGTPSIGLLVRGFRSNLWALLSPGLGVPAGIALAV